ncbi:winged helix-turn-helix domain-containing protein [Nonomuraea sp. NPDC003804]|uniref:ArsR/SmtB family transcription factor n=1 Tax=Nonomuraea sp. NPDC003804 TaxID=3154547 RepID=UPI0033B8F8CF
MLRIHFTGKDLAGVAFANSTTLPVSEAVMSLQVLRHGSGLLFSAWRRQVMPRLPAQTSLLGALVPAFGWMPDFLTPSHHAFPGDGAFEAIRGTPRKRLAADLARLSTYRRVPTWAKPLAEGDRDALDAVANALAAYYDVAIEPFNHRMRTMLAADRAWRVDTMARAGAGAVLAGLHPEARWRDPVLELPGLPGQSGDFHLEGRGLLLCPHVFCGRRPRALLNEVDIPVLVYPPVYSRQNLGLVIKSSTAQPHAPAALAALLGRTRAAVLDALAEPTGHTTKQLAERLGISPASASEHANVLRAAGLVTSVRHANTVRHTLTPLGAGLLTPESREWSLRS